MKFDSLRFEVHIHLNWEVNCGSNYLIMQYGPNVLLHFLFRIFNPVTLLFIFDFNLPNVLTPTDVSRVAPSPLTQV